MPEKIIQTGSQTVGPFFHYGLIFGGENILVDDMTRGPRIVIEGTVFDGDGEPVPDAMIEIWQADAAGIYNHPADPKHEKVDPHFGGFGRSDTVDDGRFYFKTIMPGALKTSSEGGAPHVNVRVFSRGMLTHAVTRIYFEGESKNAADPALSSIDPARRHTLVARRIDNGDLPTFRFDIRLQGAGETVFFNP